MDIKPDNKFKQSLLLIVIGVLLMSALLNFSEVLGVFNLMIGLFMPLLVGGAIAFIMNVPMSFFERQIDRLSGGRRNRFLEKIKSPLCIIITFAIFVGAIYFIGNVIFPNLVESVKSIAAVVQQSYPGWITALDEKGINTDLLEKYFTEIDTAKIVDTLKSSASTILSTAGQAATSVFSVMTNFVLGLIFAIYILAAKKKLGRQARQMAYAYLSKSRADNVCEIASLAYRTFANFLSGQCLEAVILGCMFFVVLFIGNFPYAATIAVVIGSMALIPYVGAFMGLLSVDSRGEPEADVLVYHRVPHSTAGGGTDNISESGRRICGIACYLDFVCCDSGRKYIRNTGNGDLYPYFLGDICPSQTKCL